MQNIGYYNDAAFPWHESSEDKRFRRIVRICLIIAIIISIVIPFLPTPEVEKKQLSQVSPRLAKLIIKKKTETKLPPKVSKKKKPAAKPKAKSKTSAKKKAPVKKAVKQNIEKSGVLAFSSELASLRESFDVGKIENTRTVKTQEKTHNASKLISSSANKLSSGVDKNSLTVATVDRKLAGHSTSSVASNISTTRATSASSGRAASQTDRTREEIEAIFQKYKGAFYSMYNRALRKDPSIQGRVVVKLTITPSGTVSAATIISSDLANKSLERKIIARVKLMRFKARNVKTVTVNYPIDFFPS